MKKFLIIILIGAIFGIGWYFRSNIIALTKNIPRIKNELGKNQIVAHIAREINAPSPLIGSEDFQTAHLTRAGVISQTNVERKNNGGLIALKENAQLDAAALEKVQDMFKQQYFEHVSPSGNGPETLATDVHYEYIYFGENLALGNFKNDQTLVTAWMNSPGHRANILNAKYQEIGVAVGRGLYKGKMTWLAVQEFGKPASSCPSIDPMLKDRVDSSKADVDQYLMAINQKKAEIDALHKPTTKEESDSYNAQVNEYNAMVIIYNQKLQVSKNYIEQYNAQVEKVNSCRM